jgi:hypothetical protein
MVMSISTDNTIKNIEITNNEMHFLNFKYLFGYKII